SMGVWAGDWDGSGRPSIWVTNYENEYHALYRNSVLNNSTTFNFGTMTAGISAIGPTYVAFGTCFIDPDNQGWEGIAIANGHVIHYPAHDNLKQQPILFLNVARQTKQGTQRFFVDASSRGGSYFKDKHRGRGLALGDLDNNGRQDLIFVNQNEPVRILRN